MSVFHVVGGDKMAERKRQHYVPQFYLKNFTSDNTTFNILNVANGKIIESAPINRQCYAPYFYQSDEIEIALGELETLSAPIIKEITKSNYLKLTQNDEIILKTYTVFQFFRTVGQCEYILKSYGGVLAQISKYYTKDGFSSTDIEDYIRRNRGKLLPQESLYMASSVSELINDLRLTIITFSHKHPLISSDNPVAIFNNYYKQSVGFAMAGIIITMPLSTNKVLVIYDSKMYMDDPDYGIVHESKYKDSLILNRLQLYNANKIVYGKTRDIMEKVKPQLDSSRKAIQKKHSSIVSTLGPLGNQMIIEQGPWPLIDTNISFLRLVKEAHSIPVENRDYFQRKYEHGWDERLSVLREIPSVMKKVKPKMDRNYDAHIQFVLNYWNR